MGLLAVTIKNNKYVSINDYNNNKIIKIFILDKKIFQVPKVYLKY